MMVLSLTHHEYILREKSVANFTSGKQKKKTNVEVVLYVFAVVGSTLHLIESSLITQFRTFQNICLVRTICKLLSFVFYYFVKLLRMQSRM